MTQSEQQAGTEHRQAYDHEEEGYQKSLGKRQLQMIAIGGAIGTGLFLGAGGRLASAGPALAIVYAICGFFVFLILRALGELVLHRPSSGSFVSYAREFYGEKAAYVAGWLYWLNWAFTSIVDTTAIALYMKYWGAFEAIPQWVIALVALVVVLGANLVSVKLFGEMEFWFAMIKVIALVAFLVVGVVFLAGRFPVNGQETGFSVISDNGGLIPTGLLPVVVITSGVVFAYAATELVGTAAGETENPEKIMPRAVNSVIARIALFYVGSLVLLALLLPYTAYEEGTSPFVTFFASIGVPGAGTIMNLVVLTAALSSLNAGLYSTGRILRSMAKNGSAPKFTERMNRQGVPYGGIGLTALVTLVGVGLNYLVPDEAFEIVLNIASIGILASWGTIVLCQMRFVKMTRAGVLRRPSFRLPASPYSGGAVLVFLLAVLVLMAIDYPVGTYTIASVPLIAVLLVLGWFAVRGRVMSAANERMGYTGEFPVRADRPYPGDRGDE